MSRWEVMLLRSRIDDFNGDQDDAEVTDFHEQPMQGRLVTDETAKACRAVAFMGQGKAVEPGRPVVVEVPFDPKPVAIGHLSPVGPDHQAAALAIARPDRCMLLRRWMTYSATARLMAHPAPSMRSVVSVLAPKTAFPRPRVNTWVPAPRAKA